MHAKAHSADASDSMKMFRLGLEGGKPPGGQTGVQPEWFYKGDGRSIVAPEQPLPSPDFALDGGEEPELAGIYTIAADGTPFRLGFTLANEFSDHVLERSNYMYLAHSKLRPAALGPELWVGDLPADIRGTARITRNGTAIWSKPFLTGEANMSHHLRNLEHHHFKYALFRRPDDLHVHFFGTATLSFTDGVKAQDGDVFEIEAPPFSPLPAKSRLKPTAGAGDRRNRTILIDMKLVRIGIVGIGKIARDQHIPAIADNAALKLAAACQPPCNGGRACRIFHPSKAMLDGVPGSGCGRDLVLLPQAHLPRRRSSRSRRASTCCSRNRPAPRRHSSSIWFAWQERPA